MNITTMKYHYSAILDMLRKYLYKNLITIVIAKNKDFEILKTKNEYFEHKTMEYQVFKN